jgi:hypothetical protein
VDGTGDATTVVRQEGVRFGDGVLRYVSNDGGRARDITLHFFVMSPRCRIIILSMYMLTPRSSNNPALALTFIQTSAPLPAHQAHRKTPEFVYIHLLLLRLKEHGTDIMVTINIPHYAGEYEKAGPGEETRLMKDSWPMREKVLESLRVVEWGLFEG